MNHIHNAIKAICTLEEFALQYSWLNRRHPLIKLLVTFTSLLTVTSIHKYALLPLLILATYPIILFTLSKLNLYHTFSKLKIFFSLALFVGIANPFLDTIPLIQIHDLTITGGIISFLSFTLKGILTITASYLFIASTTIKDICTALRILRVPSFFLTQILLMYRYIIILLHTAMDMQFSYQLRTNAQHGIALKDWGTFAGQLLLHSFHRAEQLYQSMLLRNYTPETFYLTSQKITKTDIGYLLFWLCFFLFIKGWEKI